MRKTYKKKRTAKRAAKGREIYKVKGPPAGWRISRGRKVRGKRGRAQRRRKKRTGQILVMFTGQNDGPSVGPGAGLSKKFREVIKLWQNEDEEKVEEKPTRKKDPPNVRPESVLFIKSRAAGV